MLRLCTHQVSLRLTTGKANNADTFHPRCEHNTGNLTTSVLTLPESRSFVQASQFSGSCKRRLGPCLHPCINCEGDSFSRFDTSEVIESLPVFVFCFFPPFFIFPLRSNLCIMRKLVCYLHFFFFKRNLLFLFIGRKNWRRPWKRKVYQMRRYSTLCT